MASRSAAARPLSAGLESPPPPRATAVEGLAAFIAAAKYARYRREWGRWETFPEIVGRVEAMHRRFFREKLGRHLAAPEGMAPEVRDEIDGRTLDESVARAFAAVAAKRVLPSMRSLQFAGREILANHARLFNCAFSPVDRWDFFREYLFLLLSGVGCGFSVQREHVERLSALPHRQQAATLSIDLHALDDSAEGWAGVLQHVIDAGLSGGTIVLPGGDDRRGARSMRRAALWRACADVQGVLAAAAGRKLRPIEVYDLCLFLSRAVLSGGNRRSASICLFSADDEEMMHAKSGAWLRENPQRAACNNSAVLVRAAASEADFRRLFEVQQEYGEPGFFFTDDADYGCNPCGEAGLDPVWKSMLADDCGHPTAQLRLSGWQLCNLSTINGAAVTREADFFAACVHAAVLGTLQAAYSDIPYLGPVTLAINEHDALLGVSICGFMDNPGLLFAPALLERGARVCREANACVAGALGIRPAARVTCVKPEGTASLLLGASPGIHPRPARRYFRRIQCDRGDPAFRQFRAANAALTEPSASAPGRGGVVVFPLEAPPGALVRADLGAVEFLRRVLLVQKHWVLAGEAAGGRAPGLHHNVSHTCAVHPGEWAGVADFIWAHRAEFSGVTFLGDDAARRYTQPPFEPVEGEEDLARWRALEYRGVDYTRAPPPALVPRAPGPDECVAGACEG